MQASFKIPNLPLRNGSTETSSAETPNLYQHTQETDAMNDYQEGVSNIFKAKNDQD